MTVQELLNSLSPKEERILRLLIKGHRYADVAEDFGTTAAEVQEIEAQTLSKLRRHLGG